MLAKSSNKENSNKNRKENPKIWMAKEDSMESGDTLNETIKFATKSEGPPANPGKVYKNLGDA